jgi:hypothetical protein
MSRKLVSVQISSGLFLELANYLQEFGDERDPAEVVESALASWLRVARGDAPEAEVRGYQWKRLFLPEGTELKMSYRGLNAFAKVVGDSVVYQGQPTTPNQFVAEVAGTARNAGKSCGCACLANDTGRAQVHKARTTARAASGTTAAVPVTRLYNRPGSHGAKPAQCAGLDRESIDAARRQDGAAHRCSPRRIGVSEHFRAFQSISEQFSEGLCKPLNRKPFPNALKAVHQRNADRWNKGNARRGNPAAPARALSSRKHGGTHAKASLLHRPGGYRQTAQYPQWYKYRQ